MIDKVIICGIRRANQLISANEINQMCGRAGRSYTSSGEAIILSSSDDYKKSEEILYGKLPPIESVMDELENISFHVLPMILYQKVYNEKSFYEWYEHTLSYIQGKTVSYKEVIDYLLEQECIAYFRENVIVNELGEISSKFYFPPRRIKLLKDRLEELIINENLDDEYSCSWLFSYDRIILGTVDEYALSNYKSELLNKGYIFNNGELIHGYVYYCLFTGIRPKWLKYTINGEYDDFDRLINACNNICLVKRYKIEKELLKMQYSVKKRVNFNISKIMCELDIYTKKYILELIDLGIKSKKDIEFMRDKIISYGTLELKNILGIKGYI